MRRFRCEILMRDFGVENEGPGSRAILRRRQVQNLSRFLKRNPGANPLVGGRFQVPRAGADPGRRLPVVDADVWRRDQFRRRGQHRALIIAGIILTLRR